MELGLAGKRVLVTGSSRGIGFGICDAFVKEGARIMLTGRDSEILEGARIRLSDEATDRDSVLGFACDLTQEAQVGDLLAAVKSNWQALDVLVLNLGSGRSVPGLSAQVEEWRRVLELNLISSLMTLSRCESLLMEGDSPSIVFIGSIAGGEALGAPYTYGAAKAGLSHTVKAASRDLGPKGMRVNLVSPGNVYFEGGTWERKMAENREGVQAMLKREVPLARFSTVKEIADVVVFLSSPRASFVNGANWVVDGGQTRSV